jgi:hypothetical protein
MPDYDLSDPTLWQVPGAFVAYRTLPGESSFGPVDSFKSINGRYSNGQRFVLYLAASPEVAVAEFLRWHPEFIDLQSDLRISVFEIQFDCSGQALDVSDELQTQKIPFPFERLISSEPDAVTRYAECRSLAADCELASGEAIRAPSAAWPTSADPNTTLFGEDCAKWLVSSPIDVGLPTVDPALVRIIG